MLTGYRPETMSDPDMLGLARTVTLVPDHSGRYDRAYSADPLCVTVRARVITNAGELVAECHASTGNPAKPYSNEALTERVAAMTRATADPDRVLELADAVFDLESVSDMTRIGELLQII